MNAAPIKALLARFKSSHTEPDHADKYADKQCGNCNTQIIGNYCHACGQSAHVHQSLLHLVEEMVHGLWHFDAKGWRTIPLLIAYPGDLTRRYIDGQRVRFISPLALFLFMVFFMFFVFSFSGAHVVNLNTPEQKAAAISDIDKDIAKSSQAVAQAKEKLEQAKKSGTQIEERQSDLDNALTEKKVLEATRNELNDSTANSNSSLGSGLVIDDGQDSGKPATGMKAVLINAYQHYTANRDLFFYKMKNNAYKFALILVPLSLPILWVMFIGKKNITMFDHAVFALYSLSFMAFFSAILSILFHFKFDGLAVLLTFVVPPLHMYRQLKGTYRLSGYGALWRALLLSSSACVMLLLFMVFVATLALK